MAKDRNAKSQLALEQELTLLLNIFMRFKDFSVVFCEKIKIDKVKKSNDFKSMHGFYTISLLNITQQIKIIINSSLILRNFIDFFVKIVLSIRKLYD